MINEEMIKNKFQRGLALTVEESLYFCNKYIESLEQKPCEEEQQPCEDCISLNKLDDIITKAIDESENQTECQTLRWVLDVMSELPSVTPKQKTGKWKLLSCTYGHGCVYTCSKCGETEFYVSNYCPNCGCQMKGEE